MKILVADDEENIRELVSDLIEAELQDCEVLVAKDGEQAVDIFFSNTEISLCILDIMMPIYDGFEVLEMIRQHSDVPILMLTALGEPEIECKGFDKGVNDYISKPFHLDVLVARIKRLCKENRKNLQFSHLKVDLSGHNVWVFNEEINLTPREYSLLVQLVQNEAVVLTREQLLERAWGYDYDGEERTVDTHIKSLRKKLSHCGEYIHTIRGTGYKFQVPL